MSLAEKLARAPLFRGVPDEDRQALLDAMRRMTVPKGRVIFERGDAGDAMFLVVSGRVRIYSRDSSGREFTIRYLTDLFGEFSLLDGQPRSASAQAVDDLELLMLSRDDFVRFVMQRPLVGLAMMRSLVERVRYTTAYLQQVLDATRQLAEGMDVVPDFSVPESESDREIVSLVAAFLRMMRQVGRHSGEGGGYDR